ncbi:MAG TPA: stalk domain-containing protein [Anaerovoracaceae bacterium]|nr:stalk domain-containing protein [Anaerovoracaceae bacterium]
MFKKLTVSCIILGLIFSIISPRNVYASEINININNQPVQFLQNSGEPFIDQANRTQVPFRLTMESFGCAVSWDNENQTAIAEKDGTIVTVPIGESYIMKDGEKIANDTAALIKDSRTYLPIRAVLEAFGAFVEWQPDTQSVMVSTIDPNKIMTVHFLDVGQADSIFIDMGSYEILIDGGNNADGPLVVNYLKPYVDGNLELIVATHAHEDHIGGLDNVISAYQIDTIIYSDETSSTISFNDFYHAAISEPNCKLIGDSDKTIDLGYGAQFKTIEMGDGLKDPNENSVVSMIDYNDIEVLFMGDLEATTEMNNLGKFSDIDVLKVGHHGSRTSSSQAFLDIIRPDVSIISAGLTNKYSLPNADIIARLHSMDSVIYGTFRSGNIILTTDGEQYRLNTNLLLTSEDAGAPASSSLTH